jgi:hypothetical protein
VKSTTEVEYSVSESREPDLARLSHFESPLPVRNWKAARSQVSSCEKLSGSLRVAMVDPCKNWARSEMKFAYSGCWSQECVGIL